MPLSTEERLRRRRRAKRRKRLVLTGLLLVFLCVVALVVWLVVLAVGALGTKNPAPETSIPAPTAAYPTCDPTEVAGQVHMNSILLYDATHHAVLYEQNADAPAYPASTTKLLTALTACRYGNPNATYTISSEQALVEWDASRAYLEEGKAYPLAGLLDGLLLPSGADAAYCLAANVARYHENNPNLTDGQAVEIFVGYMNTLAAELGCTGTHFVTPDGYHDPYHVTTARDMLKIAEAALACEPVAATVKKAESEYGDWENGNLLVCPDEPYYYEYATGLKTGYTDEAGFCLAASAERNGVKLIAIMFQSISTEYRFLDAQNLFERGFALAEHPPTTTVPRLFKYFDTAATAVPAEESAVS